VGSIGGKAVVVGGSIGGLVAAAALTGRFDQITVIDRDTLPPDDRPRRGVPQGVHAHALLISGRLGLEELFPGLTDELIRDGAVPFDPGQDLLFVQMGAPRIRFRTDMLGISMSRSFLEFSIRRRVTALPGVEIRDRVAAGGLRGRDGRVTGVELDDGTVLDADLVVDATGRGGGRSDRWLEALGFPAPSIATVRINVGYTTQLLRRKPGDLPDDGVIALMADMPPHRRRAAAVFPVEGDRWVVTIGGWHREHAPTDPDGFLRFAEGLPAPWVAGLLSRAETLGDAEFRQYPAARRRYYERLRSRPAGYVALGDTICSFNPLYGQGMTVATLEALALRRSLDRHREPSPAMARTYYRAAGKIVETPWRMATGGDFMYPQTSGPKPPGTDLLNWYARRVLLATHVSPEVHRTILDVQHLLASPAALLRPSTVVRSFLAARRSPVRSPR